MWVLFLFIISASFLLPGYSEVVPSFKTCDSFFFQKKFPDDNLQSPNPARICQKYKDRYIFATMYDRDKRIPIYSAYVYNPEKGKRSKNWMIEPQLAKMEYSPNMEEEKSTKISVAEIKRSQATSEDYRLAPGNTSKGHLSPVAHQPDEVSKNATFTLTNIVPQSETLNNGPWNNYETKTMKTKNDKFGCTKIYVITGVVPGDTFIAEGRVNYPSHIWSAACCEIDQNRRESWGAIADNDRGKKNTSVTVYTLPKLENDLRKWYNKKVDLFSSSCY